MVFYALYGPRRSKLHHHGTLMRCGEECPIEAQFDAVSTSKTARRTSEEPSPSTPAASSESQRTTAIRVERSEAGQLRLDIHKLQCATF